MPRIYIIIAITLIFLVAAPGWASEAGVGSAQGTITLDEALDLALANNLELKAAEEGVAAAQFGIKAAKALDRFSMTATESYSKAGPGITEEVPVLGELDIRPSKWQDVFSIALSQPIFTFGLNRNILKLAEYGLDSALADYQAKLNEIKYNVESSYYDLVQLEMLLDVQQQNLERAQNDKHNAELRFEAGQSAKFEVIRADVAVKNAEEQLIGTKKKIEVAKLAWTRLIGIGEYREPVVMSPEAVTPLDLSFTLDEAREVALRMRPELKGLAAGIGSAERGASLKSLRPDLRFIGSYNLSSWSTAFTTKEDWRLGLNLNIPLWDGGKANADVAKGMALAEQLRIKSKDMEELIKIEVADAYLGVAESAERMNATAATLALAEEAKRMAEIGYTEGVVTLQELLSAEVDLSGAKVNRIVAVYGYLKAKAKLRKAMGVDALLDEMISK